MFNKKATVGETITWIVATVIIIVILAFSIFISSFYLGESKTASSFKSIDVLASKSLFSYLLTTEEEAIIYDQLKTDLNLNDVNGELAVDIFKEFYEDEYKNTWVGVLKADLPSHLNANTYFGAKPSDIIVFSYDAPKDFISDGIKLNETASVGFIWVIK